MRDWRPTPSKHIHMCRLIVSHGHEGGPRKCVLRRQLTPYERKTLNDTFKLLKLSDRWVKERTRK